MDPGGMNAHWLLSSFFRARKVAKSSENAGFGAFRTFVRTFYNMHLVPELLNCQIFNNLLLDSPFPDMQNFSTAKVVKKSF